MADYTEPPSEEQVTDHAASHDGEFKQRSFVEWDRFLHEILGVPETTVEEVAAFEPQTAAECWAEFCMKRYGAKATEVEIQIEAIPSEPIQAP